MSGDKLATTQHCQHKPRPLSGTPVSTAAAAAAAAAAAGHWSVALSARETVGVGGRMYA